MLTPRLPSPLSPPPTKLLEQPIGDNARAEAYHHRGDAYANLGHFAEAAADYRAAIGVVPIDSTAWGGLIQVLKEHPNCEGEPVDWQKVVDDMEAALATIGEWCREDMYTAATSC